MISFIWHDLLYVPLYNLLLFFYAIQPESWRDMGLAVIFLTIFMRVVLLPFSIRAARSEHKMNLIRPIIAEIKERYKYDLQKQRDAVKALLRKNRIGVFSNVVSLIFQILVFVVLYDIFSSGLQPIGKNEVYGFIPETGVIEPWFLDRLNLIVPSVKTSLVASGVVLFNQALKKASNFQEITTLDKALVIGLPVGTFLATVILPSAKAIFLATSVTFTLWIRLVRWVMLKYVVKDDELKENIEQLWKN